MFHLYHSHYLFNHVYTKIEVLENFAIERKNLIERQICKGEIIKMKEIVGWIKIIYSIVFNFQSLIGSILGVTFAYLVAVYQIKRHEEPVVVVELKKQKVKNIGEMTALNVNVFRVFNNQETCEVSLCKSLGCLIQHQTESIDLKTTSDIYEIFVIQYQSLSGKYYESYLVPMNMKGDYESFYNNKKISRKNFLGTNISTYTDKKTCKRFKKIFKKYTRGK